VKSILHKKFAQLIRLCHLTWD